MESLCPPGLAIIHILEGVLAPTSLRLKTPGPANDITAAKYTQDDPRNHTNEHEEFSNTSCDFVDRLSDPRYERAERLKLAV